ncbi:NEDD4/BSD2 [Dipodascopsis tothii]|uniref:NEDD4/BSD2 n=1 Tax=Dipodascopsis tothii TaxID=44089 RepID=UPI0034CE9E64
MARRGKEYSKLDNETDETAGTSAAGGLAAGAASPASPPPSFRSTASFIPIPADDPLARSFELDGDEDSDDELYGAPSHAVAAHDADEPREPSAAGPAGTADEAGSSVGSSVGASAGASSSSSPPGLASSNDGVFANITAKPDTSEKPTEETPPSYEEAAADATPPYWETTILSPGAASDDVYIEGLPVGNFFNFAWNMLISMSFQFVGFLLTYLLHTTHAARNGSLAGLGVTLIQYGMYMGSQDDAAAQPNSTAVDNYANADPNSYVVTTIAATNTTGTDAPAGGRSQINVVSLCLNLAGWFLLVKSFLSFFRVRRMERVILQTPSAPGTGPAHVGAGESPETAV